MRRLLILMLWCLMVVMPKPGRAYTLPVIDVGAIAQFIVSNANWTKSLANDTAEIQNQVTQITHLVQQIQLMTINLQDITQILPFLRTLDGSLATLATSAGVPYQRSDILAALLNIYPTYGTAGYPGLTTLQQYDRHLSQQVWDATRGAMVNQGVMDDLTRDTQALQTQIDVSRSSVGNLSATKANTELVGLNTAQLLRMQSLQATNNRALTSKILEETATQESVRQYQDFFYAGTATQPIPRPVIRSLP